MILMYLCKKSKYMSSRYENRGVSADKSEVHSAIKNLDKGLYPNAFCKILPDYITGDEAYCTIMHADTAGTKTSLAYMYWRETSDISIWEGIVQDALVMNLDDMACSGMIDNFIISSTIGRNKSVINGEVLSVLINATKTFADNMKLYGINLHLAGGETADVGDIVRTADVGFTAFGRMKRNEVINIDIKKDDYIVGFASYGTSSYETEYNGGMGSNGLTSARHDVFHSDYATKYPETYNELIDKSLVYSGSKSLTEKINIDGQEIPLGKLVLSPTRTFLPVIRQLITFHKADINGIIHNTGGGQYKVEKFIGEGLCALKDNLLPVPPLFNIIQEESKTSTEEMYKVFNMGTRLEVYTSSLQAAESMIDIASQFNIDAQIIGRVTEGNERVKVVPTA
jgi:phosphoribosylformylglycinamidine cyclo-ligase